VITLVAVLVHVVWVAVLVGLPAFVAVSRLLGIRRTGALALLQDAGPLVLILVWIGLFIAIDRHAWIIAIVAGLVAMYHVYIVISLMRPRPVPRWVEHAPTTTLAIANIYIDNDQFDEAARQLLDTKADCVVIVETTPDFRKIFDDAGADSLYPFRTFDPEDNSDYAVSMYCRRKPLSLGMVRIGELPAARAVVDLSGVKMQIIGVIPSAAVGPGGYELWQRQMRSLLRYASNSANPLVVAGDLNTTIHRAAYKDVRDAGLDDAHDDLGLGLRPSFKLSAKGLLSKVGPLVRLDHALTNRWVWATGVEDLEAVGSDHRPFVVTLAARKPRHARHGGRHGGRHDAPILPRATMGRSTGQR
jgi:endonuclease/exonuclease/phosphatase (EEP) superfamily protein YafD